MDRGMTVKTNPKELAGYMADAESRKSCSGCVHGEIMEDHAARGSGLAHIHYIDAKKVQNEYFRIHHHEGRRIKTFDGLWFLQP